jgi:hypothetical protein
MKNKFLRHHPYYVLEALYLVIGFCAVFIFSYSATLQLMVLILVIICYVGLGFLHHQIHHDLKPKIVLEYVLISLLVLGAFLLINSTRL